MKATVEVRDGLFRRAKEYAARQGVPLREVFKQGLEMVLRGGARRGRRFRLKTITTRGEGLVCDGSWSSIRSLTYEEHGG